MLKSDLYLNSNILNISNNSIEILKILFDHQPYFNSKKCPALLGDVFNAPHVFCNPSESFLRTQFILFYMQLSSVQNYRRL